MCKAEPTRGIELVMEQTAELCQHRVSHGRGWNTDCPHKAKGFTDDGRRACGVHLAGEKKRKDNTAKWKAARDADQDLGAELYALCKKLPESDARPHYSGPAARYSGDIVVSGEWFRSMTELAVESEKTLCMNDTWCSKKMYHSGECAE